MEDIKNKSIDDKKYEIMTKAEDLLYEDRLYILKIIIQHLPIHMIKEHADGVRINLDNFSDSLIHKIYYIINNRLSISDINRI